MADVANLRVTAKVLIKKYAEGVSPSSAEPFEIVEKEHVFIGEEALELLNGMEVKVDGIN